MYNLYICGALLIFCMLALPGCTGGHSNPSSPDIMQSAEMSNGTSQAVSDSRVLWGLVDVYVDTTTWNVSIIPVRGLLYTVNVIKFLQPPVGDPSNFKIKITDITEFKSQGLISLRVGLVHPFPGMNVYTGFDVYGVFIAHGSNVSQYNNNATYSDGIIDPILLNPDGYTRWMNPVEFAPYGSIFAFTPGKYGTNNLSDLTSTVNGYKYFADGLAADGDVAEFFGNATNLNNRGTFRPGSFNKRNYDLRFPMKSGSPQLTFQYAVVASWAVPDPKLSGDPSVIDIPSDFPINANSDEAIHVNIENNSDLYYENGSGDGDVRLALEVFDWGALSDGVTVTDQIYKIVIEGDPDILPESPVIYDQAILASLASPGSTSISSVYQIEINNCMPDSDESVPLLITIESSYPDKFDPGNGDPPTDDRLASYFTYSVPVGNCEGGPLLKALTWGGALYGVFCNDVITDSEGNIYATGSFNGSVDFDPGDGVDIHSTDANNDCNAYFSKFNSDGEFLWVKTWGGEWGDWGFGLALSPDGYIYVSGTFGLTVDLDPGPGEDFHIAPGDSGYGAFASYVSKFDSDGNYQWARTWGGEGGVDAANAVVADSGGVYVTGRYWGKCDFDPGPGEVIFTAPGWYPNAFLVKFDPKGNFLWVGTWGALWGDYGEDICMDGYGNIYVAGRFAETVDFDPGPGEDIHTSQQSGMYAKEIYVSKFAPNGDHLWARTWGPGGAWSVDADSSGNVYVAGGYLGTVDFDPGPGTYIKSSGIHGDAWLSKFDVNGNFLWARCWGGTRGTTAAGITLDNSESNIYITGYFESTTDFNPLPGVDYHSAYDHEDQNIYLSKIASDGDYIWARTWGDSGWDNGRSVTVDPDGLVICAGHFVGTVDFDPGPGFDYHTGSGTLWPGWPDAFISKMCP